MGETEAAATEKEDEPIAGTLVYRRRETEPLAIDLDKWAIPIDASIFDTVQIKSIKDFYQGKKQSENRGKRKRKDEVASPGEKIKTPRASSSKRLSKSPDNTKSSKYKTPAFVMDSDSDSDARSQPTKKVKKGDVVEKERSQKEEKRKRKETTRERQEKEKQEELEKEKQREVRRKGKERKREKEAQTKANNEDVYSNPATPVIGSYTEEMDEEALRIRREEDALIEKHRAGIELEKAKELEEKRLIEFEYSLQEIQWTFYDATGLEDDYLRNAFDLKKVKEENQNRPSTSYETKTAISEETEEEKKQKRLKKEREEKQEKQAKRRRAAIEEQPCMQCGKINLDTRFEDFAGAPSQFCSHECIRAIVKKAKSVLPEEAAEVMLMSNGCVLQAGVRVSGLHEYLTKNPHVAPVLPAMRSSDDKTPKSRQQNLEDDKVKKKDTRLPDQSLIDRNEQVEKVQKHLKEQAEKKRLEKETENMRINCKKTMVEQLLKRVKRPLDYRTTTKSIKDLVTEIEKALFAACDGDVKGKYKSWMKGFIEQVMSVRNKGFFVRVVRGMLGVPLLVSLKPEEFSQAAYSAEVDPPEDKGATAQSSTKQDIKSSVIDELLDSERDTTLEHGTHMYDHRCRICKERNKMELERVAKEREEAKLAKIEEEERRKKKERYRIAQEPKHAQPSLGYSRNIRKDENEFGAGEPISSGFCPKTPLYDTPRQRHREDKLNTRTSMGLEEIPPSQFGNPPNRYDDNYERNRKNYRRSGIRSPSPIHDANDDDDYHGGGSVSPAAAERSYSPQPTREKWKTERLSTPSIDGDNGRLHNDSWRENSRLVKAGVESWRPPREREPVCTCNLEYGDISTTISLLPITSDYPATMALTAKLSARLQVLDRMHKFGAYENLLNLTKRYGKDICVVYNAEPMMELARAPFNLLLVELFESNSVLRIKLPTVYAPTVEYACYFIALAKTEPPPDYVFPPGCIESARDHAMAFLVIASPLNGEINKAYRRTPEKKMMGMERNSRMDTQDTDQRRSPEISKMPMGHASWQKKLESPLKREPLESQLPVKKIGFWANQKESFVKDEAHSPGRERARSPILPIQPAMNRQQTITTGAAPESSENDDDDEEGAAEVVDNNEPLIPASFFEMIKKKEEEQKMLSVETIPINNVEDVATALRHDWKANEVLLIVKRFIALGRSKEEIEIVHKLCLNYIQKIKNKKMANTEKPKPRVIPTSPAQNLSTGPMNMEQVLGKESIDVTEEPSISKEEKDEAVNDAQQRSMVLKFGLDDIEASNATFTAGGILNMMRGIQEKTAEVTTAAEKPAVRDKQSAKLATSAGMTPPILEGPSTAPPTPPMLITPDSDKMVVDEGNESRGTPMDQSSDSEEIPTPPRPPTMKNGSLKSMIQATQMNLIPPPPPPLPSLMPTTGMVQPIGGPSMPMFYQSNLALAPPGGPPPVPPPPTLPGSSVTSLIVDAPPPPPPPPTSRINPVINGPRLPIPKGFQNGASDSYPPRGGEAQWHPGYPGPPGRQPIISDGRSMELPGFDQPGSSRNIGRPSQVNNYKENFDYEEKNNDHEDGEWREEGDERMAWKEQGPDSSQGHVYTGKNRGVPPMKMAPFAHEGGPASPLMQTIRTPILRGGPSQWRGRGGPPRGVPPPSMMYGRGMPPPPRPLMGDFRDYDAEPFMGNRPPWQSMPPPPSSRGRRPPRGRGNYF